MRRLLRLIGNRYGISVGLVVVVVAIVVVAKAAGGGSAPWTSSNGPGAAVTATPGPEDGEDTPAAAVSPSVSPGATDPTTIAVDFAKAWLRHQGVSAQDWYTGLSPYATADLRDQLSGVDPAGVPASQITGDPTLVPHDSGYAVVTIPVDSGLLTLRLLGLNGRWLVDGVDWGRA